MLSGPQFIFTLTNFKRKVSPRNIGPFKNLQERINVGESNYFVNHTKAAIAHTGICRRTNHLHIPNMKGVFFVIIEERKRKTNIDTWMRLGRISVPKSCKCWRWSPKISLQSSDNASRSPLWSSGGRSTFSNFKASWTWVKQ